MLRPLLVAAAAVSLFAGLACSPSATPATPTVAPGAVGQGTGPLKIGLLPTVDVLPFYVAEQKGYFKDAGVTVEAVNFSSALERDAAIQAGQTDGQLADLISSQTLNKVGERSSIVKSLYRAQPDRPQVAILAAPGSTIQSAADLKGKKIALSSNSLIDYEVDRMLAAAGLKPTDVEKVEVPRIPLRVESLNNRQVDAAGLPEPFITIGQLGGSKIVADDSKEQIGVSVLLMRNASLQTKGQSVAAMVKALDRAAQDINADPQAYRGLLAEKASLPDSIRTSFKVPVFPVGLVPSEADVKAAQDWMLQNKYLEAGRPYEELVNQAYVTAR